MDVSSIVNFEVLLNKKMEAVFSNSCADLSIAIRDMTPIDTTRAIRSWSPAINEMIDIDMTNDFAMSIRLEPIANGIKIAVSKLKLGDVYYLSNSTPYISELEYGYRSAKAPRGFFRINIAKWEGIVNGSFRT